jgi:hypothetical protein
VLAGYRIEPEARVDLAFTIGLLGAGGAATVAGRSVEGVLEGVLRQMDGARINPTSSYRVVETLARYGPFVGNPLLESMTAAERDRLALACDPTPYVRSLCQGLPPKSYVPALARCEAGRLAIGLPADAATFDDLVARTRALLSVNPGGYVDDSDTGRGAFGMRSCDVYLITEPLSRRLGDVWRSGAYGAVRFVEAAGSRNGAAVSWGGSSGALALCLTVELAALALAYDLTADAAAWLARAENAFTRLRGWFDGGLFAAHQGRPTGALHRLHRLEPTLDCLGKLAGSANLLERANAARAAAAPVDAAFPARDELVWFDETAGAGFWAYRSPALAFVLPLVGATLTEDLPGTAEPRVVRGAGGCRSRNRGAGRVRRRDEVRGGGPPVLRHQGGGRPRGEAPLVSGCRPPQSAAGAAAPRWRAPGRVPRRWTDADGRGRAPL